MNGQILFCRGRWSPRDGVIAAMRESMSIRSDADCVDTSTLIIAESWASKLTAFDIAADGSLSHRRVWAEVGGDGICLDAQGAVWCAQGAGPMGRRPRTPLVPPTADGDPTPPA